jgi:squalene-hopene/tetraprenyl-beta-curcumene cyclase
MAVDLRLRASSACVGVLILFSGIAANASAGTSAGSDDRQSADAEVLVSSPVSLDPSTLKDGLHSLDLGLRWLSIQQHPDGSWSLAQYPALTGLAVACYCLDPRRAPADPLPEAAQKGVAFLLGCVRPDGGIYVSSDQAPALPHYNTALASMALVLTGDESHRAVIENARRFLVGGQHLGSDVFSGGFGYEADPNRKYADLSSTYMVLESVWAAENSAFRDEKQDFQDERRLDWAAALEFLTRVQNLPGSNDQPWAQSATKDDRGGFVYHPGESKAGDEMSEDGSRRFHSYGSMSYAGLLSLLYADVDRDDPRVVAAVDWIRRHYTVDENPGMGAQGLYYSFHTMAKALIHWGEEPLVLPSGRRAFWRKDLARKLVSLQRIDPQTSLGYWVNDNGRWWESDPVLATTFALMALDMVLGPSARP